MRRQIIAGATMLVLAAGTTTGANALAHKAGRHGDHVGRIHAGGAHGHRARHASRIARVRESRRYDGWNEGGQNYGGFIDLGPLGITAACGQYNYRHGYCGQGYSISVRP